MNKSGVNVLVKAFSSLVVPQTTEPPFSLLRMAVNCYILPLAPGFIFKTACLRTAMAARVLVL